MIHERKGETSVSQENFIDGTNPLWVGASSAEALTRKGKIIIFGIQAAMTLVVAAKCSGSGTGLEGDDPKLVNASNLNRDQSAQSGAYAVQTNIASIHAAETQQFEDALNQLEHATPQPAQQ